MTRILIVDNEAMVRLGVKQLIADHLDEAEIGEVANPRDFIEILRGGNWDLLLWDITMCGGEGLKSLRELRQLFPKLPVLVFSKCAEDLLGIQALRAGAAGYVSKESTSEELVGAIQRVMGGGKYVSPSLAEKLITHFESNGGKMFEEALSDREYQIMLMIARGQASAEIAKELSLSAKTVSTYRSRILHKMHMKSDAELTSYVIHNQLLR